MDDASKISAAIRLGSSANTLQAVEHAAAKKLLHYDGEQYPHDGCAITLSTLLQEAGIDVPDTYQALAMGNVLLKRGWKKIAVGQQKAGDVASTCGSTPNHGSDHVFFVLKVLNPVENLIADNQRTSPHLRFTDGRDGRTPTTHFLRAL